MSDDAVRFTAKLKGDADVARLLRRYPEKVGRTLESLVKQEARGLAVELARNTRPFGFSEKAKKRGEKAVSNDINLVFGLPSKAFAEIRKSDPGAADRFWAHIANRRFARAQSALRSSGSAWNDLAVGRLDPKLHQQARNTSGEVPRRVKLAMIVTSQKSLDTYIARVQKRVGFAKGSWINAAKAIGGRVRGAVQWATRHKQAPGTATVKTGDKPAVTLVNTTDQVRPAQPPAPRGQGEARCAAGLRQAPGQDRLHPARRPAAHRRPVPPPPVTAMHDTDRQSLLSAAFHDVETIVGGHAMRPLSLASYDVLLRTGNPLVKGETPADGTPEFTAALMGFVFTHCAPWPEVVRASFNGQAFREAALIFCGGLAPGDFQTAFQRLEAQCRELEAAQVDPVGGLAGKKPLPATSPAS